MLTRLALILNPFMLLFVATALVGTQTAYAPELALQKFMLLLLALAVYCVIALLPPRWLPTLIWVGGAVSVVVALHYWFAYDWAVRPNKFAVFNTIGVAWQAVRPNVPLTPLYNGNISAGVIASFLPFLLYHISTRRNRLIQLAFVPPLLFVLATIVLIGARGVWIALAVWGTLWFVARHIERNQMVLTRQLSLLLLVPLLLGGVLALLFGRQLYVSLNVATRLSLFASTAHLIYDFPLIGAGLATFPGLYSYYVVVTPHLVLLDAHNIWLDVWLEQGVLGSVALLGIFATAFRQLYRAPLASSYKWLIFTSGIIFLSHSQIENVAYGTSYTPLLLVIPALLMMHTSATPVAVQRVWLNGAVAGVVGVCAVLVWQPNAWQVNRAALANARIDLVDYPSGEWDNRPPATWQAVAADWQAILAAAPNNRTAHHRLGLIALQAHRFEDARDHLDTAHRRAEQHAGISKNLGYAYAWQGQPQQGIVYLSAVKVASAELFAYGSWWKAHQREDLARTAFELSEQIQLQESK